MVGHTNAWGNLNGPIEEDNMQTTVFCEDTMQGYGTQKRRGYDVPFMNWQVVLSVLEIGGVNPL